MEHYSSGEFLHVQKNTIIQQFTGLLDKNGKEIYEGDIVSRSYGNDFDQYKNLSSNVVVNQFGCNIRQSERMSPDCYYKTEVIGNIFENPELLK